MEVTLEFGITKKDAKSMAKTLLDAVSGKTADDKLDSALKYSADLLDEISEQL